MDPVQPRRRVWVLPLVFTLVGLILPLELYVKNVSSEPYPGLFQPAFAQFPTVGTSLTYRALDLAIDGRTIDGEFLFPGSNGGARSRLLEAMFPPYGGSPHVDAAIRERLHTRAVHGLGVDGHTLTATWERRRFDLETRTTTVVKRLSMYEVDLTGDVE
jgi:hypothetical protein